MFDHFYFLRMLSVSFIYCLNSIYDDVLYYFSRMQEVFLFFREKKKIKPLLLKFFTYKGVETLKY